MLNGSQPGHGGRQRACGNSPTATRPPSSGGIGIMLKTASTTLIRNQTFLRLSATHCDAFSGTKADEVEQKCRGKRQQDVGAGPRQRHPAPCRARGSRSLRNLTGTGLA